MSSCALKDYSFLEFFANKRLKIADPCILLVDDDIELCGLMRESVRKYWPDCRFDCAQNSKDALKKINDTKYTLIFLDINLGNDNGLDILRKIRRENYGNDTIICVISGGALSLTGTKIAFKTAKGNWYKKKPCPLNLDTVSDLIRMTKSELECLIGEASIP